MVSRIFFYYLALERSKLTYRGKQASRELSALINERGEETDGDRLTQRIYSNEEGAANLLRVISLRPPHVAESPYAGESRTE